MNRESSRRIASWLSRPYPQNNRPGGSLHRKIGWLLLVVLCFTQAALAQVKSANYNFDSFAAGTVQATASGNTASWAIPVSSTDNTPSGLTAVVEGNGAGGSIRIINIAVGGDIHVGFQAIAPGTVSKAVIRSTDGSEFKLSAINVAAVANVVQTFSLRAMRDGVQVGSIVAGNYVPTTPISPVGFDLSSNADFASIDAIEVTTTVPQGLRLDDLAITAAPSATLTTTGTVNPFSSCAATASGEQSFTVSGSNLSGNVTVAPPAGFQLSLVSGGPYSGANLTIPQSGGSASATVYVRMAAALSSPAAGNIQISSAGATTATVALSGVVNPLPSLTIGAVQAVNFNATSFSIPYSGATGTPDQYSVTSGAAALPGFTAVTNAALSGSPIVVLLPANPVPGTYNFNLTVRNSTTGCVSAVLPFSLTINAAPAPVVTSVAVPASAVYGAGQSLDFTVNYSAAVTVTGTPAIPLVIGSTTKAAAYVAGSGSSALVFRYTVATGDVDANGITIGSSISLNGGTIGAGNVDAALALNSVGSTSGVLVDAVAPTVTSIVRVGATPTNAASLAYTVTFSEPVTGVDAGDFSLAVTGGANGIIAGVSGSGTTYTVTTNSVTGTGTLRLDLNSTGTGILDAVGNGIPSGYTSGQLYAVDRDSPAAPSVPQLLAADDTGLSGTDNITNKTALNFSGSQSEPGATVRLYFNGTQVGFTNADGSGNWSAAASAVAEGSYSVTARVEDAAGNLSAPSSALQLNVDLTAPAAAIVLSPANGAVLLTGTPAISGTAQAGTSITLITDGVSVANATTTDASGNWSYTLQAQLGPGSHTVRAVAVDIAGNTAPSSNTNTFAVSTQPTITLTGSVPALNAVYPQPSTAAVFSVSATNLTAGVLVTPPAGFEVSSDNSSFAPSVTLGAAGNLSASPVYVRLAAGTAAGNYAGNLTLSSAGATSRTLAITSSTVTPLALTVAAQAKTKAYGDADPALTFTATPALAAGDAFTGSLTRVPGENVGTYGITQGTLSAGTNYTITFTGANLQVTPKAITVTADARGKAFGTADPALTYTVSPALVAGDAFTGSLSRAPGEAVGTYPITQGTLSAGSNYALTFTGASFTIGARVITVTAATQTKVYGQADPALTYTFTPALDPGDS
ncbi:hypothetical protein C7T94_18425, partial [Pedobacter yulinensis]